VSAAPVFAGVYARTYDAMYAGKDYDLECDLLEKAFQRHAQDGTVRSVLDIACGTGGHSLRLARRGYDVAGVDGSAEMIALARRKASEQGVTPTFEVGDMRDVALGRTFDAVLIMFAGLGYLTRNADVESALTSARRHLRPGGVLFLDVWYGPAVLRQGPLERIRVVEDGDRQVIRASVPTLHAERNVMDVRVRIWEIVGSRVAGTSDEVHSVRFFFVPELEGHLRSAGLEPRAVFEFPDLDQPPRETTSAVGCVAVAV
jgi:SAM-dependent methyltransferase